MMRSSIFLLVSFVCIIFHHSACSQDKWKYGAELNYNFSGNESYQRGAVYGVNAFGIFKAHEVYVGFDVISIQSKRHRLWGFESGYKYRFYGTKRKSHVYLDLNYQFSRYCEGCANPVDYNFVPDTPGDACLAFNRVKSHLLSLGPGYELFYTKWLSTSLSAGAAANWGELNDPAFDLSQYYNMPMIKGRRTFFLGTYFIKASIRITL